MAKDNFFLRAIVTPTATDGAYNQVEIDLGSFVNLLDKSANLLRIHNIEGEVTALDGSAPTIAANTGAEFVWQITTKSMAALATLDDDAVVAKGQLWARNPDGSANAPATSYSDSHMPQHFTNGYLVAVDTLYLAAQHDGDWTDGDSVSYAIVMECSIEKATIASSTALALSQG